MIKVLHILCALNDGGIENLLLEYYKRFDRDEIVFDFAINDANEGILEKKLTEMGSTIYRYTKFRINFFQAVKDLNKIIEEGHYDIVHSHLANRGFFSLHHAKKNGVGVRISHSHSAFEPESLASKAFRIISTPLAKKYSTHLFACGDDASKWMWGSKAFKNGRVTIMKNAIDVNKFAFSETRRLNMRKKLGVEDKYVIGCVGRLSYQKNQELLIDVFNNYYQDNPESCLLIIGTGDKKEAIEKKISAYGLKDSVHLLGVRNDVEELLVAFDSYVLPSRYEGLPISVIEAQCSGLNCVLSDSITREVALSPMVKYCSLESELDEWSATLKELNEVTKADRNLAVQIINDGGYNIEIESDKLQNFYKKAIT